MKPIHPLQRNCSNEVLRFKINELINAIADINNKIEDIGLELVTIKDELGIK